MQAVKAVQILYQPTEDVLELLRTFRDMVNSCIQVGLEKGITSRFRLSNEVYHKLAGYGLHSWYALSAIEVASAMLKNYRKAKRRNGEVKPPYARRLVAKLGNQAYKIVNGQLRVPIKPGQYFYVPLHKRALAFLSDVTLRLGSITLTACTISVAFSRTAEVVEPRGYAAFDVNERSVDGVTSDGEVLRYDLSRACAIRHGYFERVRRLQAKYAKDRRVAQKAQRRWFKNQNAKVNAILHQVSADIVKRAKTRGQGIILEELRYIRNAINRKVLGLNRFNGKLQLISERSKRLKRRLNSWPFRRLQSFIKYKGEWEGVKVIYVPARNTSRLCAVCGYVMQDPKAKVLECCGIDRHLNACLNMLKAQDESLRFGLDRPASVAVIRPLNKAVSKSGEAGSTNRVNRTYKVNIFKPSSVLGMDEKGA